MGGRGKVGARSLGSQTAEYLEDLGLWGMNTIDLTWPWSDFENFGDPKLLAQVGSMTTMYRAAQRVGMATSLSVSTNEAFRTRPEAIAACCPLPDGHFEAKACEAYVSVAKPGGLDYLVEQYKTLWRLFKARGVELDFFNSGGYYIYCFRMSY